MIKVEKPRKIPKNPKKFATGLAGQGFLPIFSMTGGVSAAPMGHA